MTFINFKFDNRLIITNHDYGESIDKLLMCLHTRSNTLKSPLFGAKHEFLNNYKNIPPN